MNFLKLTSKMFDEEEVNAMIETIRSGHITYGEKVRQFEAEFAKKMKSPYAVMVNSGSSANLLAMTALVNPAAPKLHNKKILVPAVCWSTSVFPIIQAGYTPIYVDVDPYTCNISLDDLQKKIDDHSPSAIVNVHVIGNCCDMEKFTKITKNIHVIEDTCEALGSTFDNKYLGTFGRFGTYSFYYSHHITTGEGGMVVCKTKEDYELLLCLRAHGWTRHLPEKELIETKYPEIDSRFLFINTGFNVRPMDIQAAMGSVQLKKLDSVIEARKINFMKIWKKSNYYSFLNANGAPAWFGVVILLNREYEHQLEDFKAHLTTRGLEHRPVISGNMTRQPFHKLYNINVIPSDYPGAEQIHKSGLFIGLHNNIMSDKDASIIQNIFDSFKWQPMRHILVTGGTGMIGRTLQTIVDSKDKYYFIGSRDCNLKNYEQTLNLFRQIRPTHVIHLAADVGGIYKNISDSMDIGLNNRLINTNVLKCTYELNIINLIAVSSTCVFPDKNCEFSENDIYSGKPHPSYAEYAMSKRSMHIQVENIRNTCKWNWFTLIPSSMYGPLIKSNNVVNTLIQKSLRNKELEVLGTGSANRQFLYNLDFAKIIKYAVTHPPNTGSIICAPHEQYSIKKFAYLLSDKVVFNKNYTDGQINRYVKSLYFKDWYPTMEFTPFKKGIENTKKFFKSL